MKQMLLFLALFLLIASCAKKGQKNIVGRMNKTYQKSEEYRSGFIDGCGSGLRESGDKNHLHFKDLKRYNGEYRLGWDNGYETCAK